MGGAGKKEDLFCLRKSNCNPMFHSVIFFVNPEWNLKRYRLVDFWFVFEVKNLVFFLPYLIFFFGFH